MGHHENLRRKAGPKNETRTNGKAGTKKLGASKHGFSPVRLRDHEASRGPFRLGLGRCLSSPPLLLLPLRDAVKPDLARKLPGPVIVAVIRTDLVVEAIEGVDGPPVGPLELPFGAVIVDLPGFAR